MRNSFCLNHTGIATLNDLKPRSEGEVPFQQALALEERPVVEGDQVRDPRARGRGVARAADHLARGRADVVALNATSSRTCDRD